jgi:D-tyrosyl-tRNA(Tyr) deacylase
MRLLIQRVRHASVKVDQKLIGRIKSGLLVFLGIHESDGKDDVDWLVQKLLNLRIFNDDQAIMNLSIQDVKGALLVISQFTLHASTKKGNRPSYIRAAKPELAIPLYEYFVDQCLKSSLVVEQGAFGADMQIELLNDGPVTILIDSRNRE